jgi:hypothetical protein
MEKCKVARPFHSDPFGSRYAMRRDVESNAAIEIHDSTLERIQSSGDDVVAIFDAYVHRSAGRPGLDPGTGWTQPAELRFHKGKVIGGVGTLPMELLDGRLILSGKMVPNAIPMPLSHVGPSRIELESCNGACVVIEGDGVTGNFVGTPVYIEEFEPGGV